MPSLEKIRSLTTSGIKSSISRRFNLIKGNILGNAINAYWYRDVVNFGDLITPMLLKRIGFTPIYSPVNSADLLSTGSILQMAPENYSGHILGSGLIQDEFRPMTNANIWAVRGKLTMERISAPDNTVLGDPGLLVAKLLKSRQQKRYALGIVPHFVDKDDERIVTIQNKYKDDVLIIDVMRKPLDVIKDIDQCEFILSSSLHGLITADALNIPNSWINLSDKVIGKGFKFLDYFSALDVDKHPITLNGDENLSVLLKTTSKPSETIETVTEKLDQVYIDFKTTYLSL